MGTARDAGDAGARRREHEPDADDGGHGDADQLVEETFQGRAGHGNGTDNATHRYPSSAGGHIEAQPAMLGLRLRSAKSVYAARDGESRRDDRVLLVGREGDPPGHGQVDDSPPESG